MRTTWRSPGTTSGPQTTVWEPFVWTIIRCFLFHQTDFNRFICRNYIFSGLVDWTVLFLLNVVSAVWRRRLFQKMTFELCFQIKPIKTCWCSRLDQLLVLFPGDVRVKSGCFGKSLIHRTTQTSEESSPERPLSSDSASLQQKLQNPEGERRNLEVSCLKKTRAF